MPPSPTKTSLNVGTSAMMMNLYKCDLSCFSKQKCGDFYIFEQFFVALKAVVLNVCIILTLDKIFEYMKMTILSRPCGSPRIPRQFDFFV